MSEDKTPQFTSDPASRLNSEIAAWQILLNTMQEEEQALVDGDGDRLATLYATKLAQLQTVSDHSRNRQSDLQAAHHTPDRAGMEAWLAQLGQPDLLGLWQQLCDLEQEAQTTNQRIGALIEMRLSATRQALNVLVQAASGQGGLYDNVGHAVTAHKGKPLTSA